MSGCMRCGVKPAHARVNWAALVVAGAVLEAEALHRHRASHTLSHTARVLFRTDTVGGRAAFAGAWMALSAWLIPHVVRAPIQRFRDDL